jgi:WD40 repeat protein
MDQTVRVWDVDTGECLLPLSGHTDAVYAAAFHPDGTRIASSERHLHVDAPAKCGNMQRELAKGGLAMPVAQLQPIPG